MKFTDYEKMDTNQLKDVAMELCQYGTKQRELGDFEMAELAHLNLRKVLDILATRCPAYSA